MGSSWHWPGEVELGARVRNSPGKKLFCKIDYCISSACRRRNDFQKADRQGENPFAKGATRTASNAFVQASSLPQARDIKAHCWPHAQWTWTPFPKTPKWLRSGHEPTTRSLTRTRPEETYLGVLCGGTGGRLSCKKEPLGLLAEEKKQSIAKKSPPGPSFKELLDRLIVEIGPIAACCRTMGGCGVQYTLVMFPNSGESWR